METAPSLGFTQRKDGAFEACADLGVYSLAAIKRAAYKFAEDWSIQLAEEGESRLRILCCPKTPAADAAHLANAFFNEVLDNDLRETIASETAAIRNLILAHALSRTSLLNQETESGSYQDDPAIKGNS